MGDPNQQGDQLSGEDLAALHEAWSQLKSAGDPRADKLRQYIAQTGQSILHPADTRSAIRKGWDWLNQGLISKDTMVRAISGYTPEQLNEGLAPYASETPTHAAIREFVRGAVQDTGATASSLTSPLAIGTAAVGAAGKIPGAAGTIAKTVTTGASAGFAAQGANQVVTAGTDNTPEAWQQRLQGAAMVAGGVAGATPGVKAAVKAVPSPQGAMAARMAEVPPGEQFSRADVAQAARDNGVKLDLAQTTDSGIAHALKKANRYSIASQGTYDQAQTSNLNALEAWSDRTLNNFAPGSQDRMAIGSQLQQSLRNHMQMQQNAATQLYNELDQANSNVKPDATSVYDKAKEIVAENKDYYDKNPALKQSKSWQIVNDLATRDAATAPGTKNVTSPLVDSSGRPITSEVQTAPRAKPDTWTDLQKLRTDLMSEYRSPDIVGTRSEGWLKQLTEKVDNAMTGAGSGLTGQDLAKFRNANQTWQAMKNTYDNPQSPYYHAVRAQIPSKIPGMLSNGAAPEFASQLRNTLGTLEGPFQRQFVENLLNAKDGETLDLKNFNSRLGRVPQDFLVSMLGENAAKEIRLLGKVSAKVTADQNPSGTAKVGVPAAEVSGFFHNPLAGGAELGAQYAGGKLMNSPSFIDYLTKP
jgi:hypothetical protein